MLLGSLTSLQQIMLLVLDSVYDAPTLELLLRSECKHFYESFILKKTHQHFSRHLRWFTDGGRGEVGLSADLGVTALLLMKISTWPRHRHINAVNFLPGAGLNIIPALGRPLYLLQHRLPCSGLLLPNLFIADFMETNAVAMAAMRHCHLPCSGHLPPTLPCSSTSRG